MGRRHNAPGRGKGSLKLLDRLLGIPLVYILGWWKRDNTLPPEFRSIGVLVSGALGDTILVAGVIADLRKHFPDKVIKVFTTESNYECARLLIGPDSVVRLPITNPLRAMLMLRKHRVDVMCDFGSWQRINALYSWISPARFRVGFRTPGQFRHYIYHQAVEHSPLLHEVENYRAIARVLGVESTQLPKIEVAESLPDELSPASYVVFHPWSGGYKGHLKEWPESHWLELGTQINHLGLDIAITGAPHDLEKSADLRNKLASRCAGNVINLAGQLSLAQTASLLEKASAVVSVNTGIMHLAAAVGGLVLGLNGPVPGRRWGPLGERAISIDAQGKGCGYLNLGFEYKGKREDCMDIITPAQVFAILHEHLNCPVSALNQNRGSSEFDAVRDPRD